MKCEGGASVPLFFQRKFSLKAYCTGVTGCRKGRGSESPIYSFPSRLSLHSTQCQMAFVSSVSLVVFYLVGNFKISNSLFRKPAPTSFHVQPKPAKELPFCKKQSHAPFVILCESLTKGLSFMNFPFRTFITEIYNFLSLLNSKGRCCPRQGILIRYSFFM